jgi:hypothetical protein
MTNLYLAVTSFSFYMTNQFFVIFIFEVASYKRLICHRTMLLGPLMSQSSITNLFIVRFLGNYFNAVKQWLFCLSKNQTGI